MSAYGKWVPPPPGGAARTAVPFEKVKLRVFCVPGVGMGGWTCFQGWASQMPEGVELMPLELPGRMMNPAQLPYASSMQDLACQALDGLGLEVLKARPFVLFGHSFGAWLVYEMYQELSRRAAAGSDWPLPLKVYVSANRAPQLAGRSNDPDKANPCLGQLSVDAFWPAFEARYGCNPDLQSTYIRNMLQGVLQADFRLLEAYEPSSLEPLRVPLCALCGWGDSRCRPEMLSAWAEVGGAGFRERWFEGVLKPGAWATEHRYVLDSPESLLRFLRADLPEVGHGGEDCGGDTGVDGPMPADAPVGTKADTGQVERPPDNLQCAAALNGACKELSSTRCELLRNIEQYHAPTWAKCA
eukprot:CAMPEP_0183397756 /NCGR_PEP_ID=MMETSP0370-20130417/10812_1 /TAXON_ID=268820 /ORGANISM="Peridinium aciculiferum, Strain PAER-2" /LENGTH=355 /DNA_ID=CAMNT_0025578689 /DNA_START=44 /DNA_END=1106 /DNA_ORIENTATION=+